MKHFIWLPALLAIGIALYQPIREARKPKMENKSVYFSISKGGDYSSAVYKNATAGLHMTIEKVDNRGNHIKVWDKNFKPEYINGYPSFDKAAVRKVTISNVSKKKEHLEVIYTLTYYSDGAELQMQGGGSVTDKNINLKINI